MLVVKVLFNDYWRMTLSSSTAMSARIYFHDVVNWLNINRPFIDIKKITIFALVLKSQSKQIHKSQKSITCAIGWFFIRKRRIPSAWNSKDVEINLHDSGSEYDGREVKLLNQGGQEQHLLKQWSDTSVYIWNWTGFCYVFGFRKHTDRLSLLRKVWLSKSNEKN